MDTSAQTKHFPVTATLHTFANLSSPNMAFGFNSDELEVESRDPSNVMDQLPDGVVLFYFYDRLIADVVIDGESTRIESDAINLSEEQYFVDVKKVYHKGQVSHWWYRDLFALEQMARYDTDYVVSWKSFCLAYHPEVDVLLYR